MSMLEIRNLSKSYGRDLVLDDVSLDVDEGDVVAIVGPSGAGKSTFLRCINLLETFHAGSVVLNGHRVGFVQSGAKLRHMTSRELARQRRGIGMVFQDFNLFSHMTALENIVEAPRRVLGLSKADARERAASLLTQVGLSGKGDSYPHQLSGGQQQRVAIARSLAMRPQLMLFDEATSALDPELVGEVLDVMTGLAQQGMTMLVVTHEMEFAREVSSSVAVMADGRIIEAGPTSVVLSTPQNERARVFLRRTMSRAGASSSPNASSQAQR